MFDEYSIGPLEKVSQSTVQLGSGMHSVGTYSVYTNVYTVVAYL